MKSKFSVYAIAFLLVVASSLAITAMVAKAGNGYGRGNNEDLGVIYVTSQGLYYDTFGTTDLPPYGPFQKLYPPGTNPEDPTLTYPSTEFGPGDHGFVGGRWWIDVNGDNEKNEGDLFFQCPLLGPGRETP